MMPMMTTAIFSGIKKQGRNKDFKIWGGGGGGWGRNKGFWPEYLPMKLIVKTLERILD